MAMFSIKSFGGVSPKTPPRYLQDTQAQVAINCPVFAGSLVPLPNVGSSVTTLAKTGPIQSIYRYGQNIDSDSDYWFHWNYDVNVARGQIASDPSEWTFFTGTNTEPRATYNAIALTNSELPSATIPLGVKAPISQLNAVPVEFDPTDDYPAELYLDSSALDKLTTAGFEVSFDDRVTWTLITLADLPATNRAAYVTTRFNAVVSNTVAAAEVDEVNNVKVTTVAEGPSVYVYFRGITGSKTDFDTTSTFTPNALNKTATGTARDQIFYPLSSSRWQGSRGTTLLIRATRPGSNDTRDLFNNVSVPNDSSTATATAYAAWMTGVLNATAFAGALVFTAYGTSVVITPGTNPVTAHGFTSVAGTSVKPGSIRVVVGSSNTFEDKTTVKASADQAGVALTFLTVDEFNSFLKDKFATVSVDGGSTNTPERVYDTYDVTSLAGALAKYNLNVYSYSLPNGLPLASDNSVIVIETTTRGVSTSFTIRGGTYSTTTSTDYFFLSAVGSEDAESVPETRVYTYTWVSSAYGRTFESGPAVASESDDVYDGQAVELTNFATVPSDGLVYTGIRIYRSVSGVYLLVDDVQFPAPNEAISTYTDTKAADDLAEEMYVTNWEPPPSDLQGLINLPNGMMAGFVGNDIFFCEPYYPHAWPRNYSQTIDYPIVGLGRMDTTLVVLTKGTPYFIQGSHPDSMVSVKSDLEQSCASKRSIVSFNGVVFYASPDGLVMLSSGGSKLITENMFTRAQWQAIAPDSIHAYHHDMKYVAFYDTGDVQGGFVYDLISGQFIFHNIYATAGYSDMTRDQLFLAFADNEVRKWFDGEATTYTWRSKLFTMPQVMGFSCAQVEAETYPVTAKFYCDNAVTPFHTQTVASRKPFRLPVKVGRDWEVQLEGTAQVFSVAVGQSMEELASA